MARSRSASSDSGGGGRSPSPSPNNTKKRGRSRSASGGGGGRDDNASNAKGGRSPSPAGSAASSHASSSSSSASSGDDEPAKLHVSGLSRNVAADHLREIFGTFGALRGVELAVDRRVGLSRGFGYVEFEHRREAEGAYGVGWKGAWLGLRAGLCWC